MSFDGLVSCLGCPLPLKPAGNVVNDDKVVFSAIFFACERKEWGNYRLLVETTGINRCYFAAQMNTVRRLKHSGYHCQNKTDEQNM